MADSYSPSGIFLGLTATELADLKATALDRIANGDMTALSGAGKSNSLQYSMSAREMLIEVNYALASGEGRVNRVVYDVRKNYYG